MHFSTLIPHFPSDGEVYSNVKFNCDLSILRMSMMYPVHFGSMSPSFVKLIATGFQCKTVLLSAIPCILTLLSHLDIGGFSRDIELLSLFHLAKVKSKACPLKP